MKVAIIGYGWVGKAMHKLFPHAEIYDPNLVRSIDRETDEISYQDTSVSRSCGYIYEYLLDKNLINNCDVAFVCVPTPYLVNSKGIEDKLDTSIVEECISWLKTPLIVIRSTLNPGTTDYLSKKYKKKIVVQPEYLGETVNHPLLDPTKRQFLIIGGKSKDRRKLIELYTTCYNADTNIRQVTAEQAEIIKLTENRAIFFKLSQCQELYDICEKAGEDYYTIRDAVFGDDPRFNLWWTFIYPDKRGANSKCIPKDVYAWCAWAESLGYNPKITRSLLERNKEWIK